MSTTTPSEDAAARIFDDEIVPVIFPEVLSEDRPRITIPLGQPGSSVGRALPGLNATQAGAYLSAIELRAFHPRYADLSQARAPEGLRILQESASAWMRSALEYSRSNKRPIVLDGTHLTPEVALAATDLFSGSGFDTTVAVVAVPRAESLLATASTYLLNVRAGRIGEFVSLAEHDRGLADIRALLASLEAKPSVDQLTIIGRDGAVLFDAVSADPVGFVGALTTFDDARATPLPAAVARRWLSELRATTDYALSFRQIPAPLADVLVELHEIGRREILPPMRLPEDSVARAKADAALAARLDAVRAAARVEQRPERRPGPSTSIPEVDRTISI